MTAGSLGDDDTEELDFGLISGHAYSLLGAFDTTCGGR
jgi:hypothetical protein